MDEHRHHARFGCERADSHDDPSGRKCAEHFRPGQSCDYDVRAKRDRLRQERSYGRNPGAADNRCAEPAGSRVRRGRHGPPRRSECPHAQFAWLPFLRSASSASMFDRQFCQSSGSVADELAIGPSGNGQFLRSRTRFCGRRVGNDDHPRNISPGQKPSSRSQVQSRRLAGMWVAALPGGSAEEDVDVIRNLRSGRDAAVRALALPR